MTMGSKTLWSMRSARRRPARARAMTTGARTASRARCSGRIMPRLREKGSLVTLTRKKNQAVVPRKALTG